MTVVRCSACREMTRTLTLAAVLAIALAGILAPVAAARPGRLCEVPLRWYGAQSIWIVDRSGGTALDGHEASYLLEPGRYTVTWSTGREARLRVNGGCRIRWS